MKVNIDPSWKPHLEPEFDKEYFQNLVAFVKEEYTQHTCYPKGKDIFAAFDISSFEDTQVIIIGQDPYHGPGQAHGLSFSVQENIPIPPSLFNIYEEIKQDLGITHPGHGDLQRWAKQGVLLLNAVLTVRAHQAGSHQNKGWEKFTDAVIDVLNKEKENLVFMLWGGYAKKKGARIDRQKHLVLESGHPSPLSANRGYWFGNKHFSKCNEYLEAHGKKSIDWR